MKIALSLIVTSLLVTLVGGAMYVQNQKLTQEVLTTQAQAEELDAQYISVQKELVQTAQQLDVLRNEDPRKVNKELQETLSLLEQATKQATDTYEQLVSLREQTRDTVKLDEQFATVLSLLSQREYASASVNAKVLAKAISVKKAEIAASDSIPSNVAVKNDLPGSGYSRQVVQSEVGEFLVDIIAADLNSTRVIVDTASDGNCGNDCPVLSLSDFVSRSGAFAGINGPYFCPAAYPSCDGKKNSFDTLLMNKNKTYFNSDNNVYSTVPAVIFSGSSARWVSRSLEWGRDTGVDAVIASQPLLILNGSVVFGGDGEIKRSGKGTRSFIGTKGSTVYIGVVRNANVAEVARVLKAMGMENALNLDSGGSTALMSGGRYIAGPGRNTPFGILFVRK